MRKGLIALTLLLSACASTVPERTPAVHGAMPVPLIPCEVEWKVIEHEERAYVGVTWAESLTLATCNSDIKRYIRQLLNTTCEYRKELEEPVCTRLKESNDTSN